MVSEKYRLCLPQRVNVLPLPVEVFLDKEWWRWWQLGLSNYFYHQGEMDNLCYYATYGTFSPLQVNGFFQWQRGQGGVIFKVICG